MSQIIEQTKKLREQWEEIEWDHHRNYVRRIQERIFRETRNSDQRTGGDIGTLEGKMKIYLSRNMVT